jgi:dienelactone hydrolase
MSDTVLPKPEPEALDNLLRAQALALHAEDKPPQSKKEWDDRRNKLRAAMFAAMGEFPDSPCALEPQDGGILKREGYRIEKLLLQTRPDVWMTASAYVPDPIKGKVPAVLVVHGHWPWARRDPVVQARCLGLVKLGFFVLAVDAFGAGERYTKPGRGTYHGALYGSTLWPTGQTLLGMQVYDNRRAVDYLQSRPEVDGDRLGVTGASGGGNQTMYAGALDERFRAVVPVCSVGTYQAYLHAACCVCEVLPGALRFAEEGDVLALVAPRALLVVNATKDGFQFSVGEAEKSIARARPVFQLYEADAKLRHATFESPHDYNQAMRETMYGWMTKWLKEEGDGKPIPEPKHEVEKPEDLSCLVDQPRPKMFLFPPSFAAREAERVLKKAHPRTPDHKEEWEAVATHMRTLLRNRILGAFPEPSKPKVSQSEPEMQGGETTTAVTLYPEEGVPIPFFVKSKARPDPRLPACIFLHLDGKSEALKHPLAKALLDKKWAVIAPDLRGTGETKPTSAAIAGAPDHHLAEHGLWLGRPLLGQWVFDVQTLLDWMIAQPALDKEHLSVVGTGPAAIIAIIAAGLSNDRIASIAAIDGTSTYVTDQAYSPGTYMGLLAPGILAAGDIAHLAALIAPRKLVIFGGITPSGKKLTVKEVNENYAYTTAIYKIHDALRKIVLSPWEAEGILKEGDVATDL